MNYKERIIKSQEGLKVILKEKERIITKANFGPSKETTIPFILNEEIAFFVGAIIGDGHLKKSKFQVVIECTNRQLIEYIQLICKRNFWREFNVRKVKLREGKQQSFAIGMDSKSIYNLLKEVFEIPIGKKSHIVKIPSFIFNSNKSIKSAFLIGIMMTEGGSRRRMIGISTASKQLWEGLINLFDELKINLLRDKWFNRKYNKEYYGIAFKPSNLKILMRECRSGQTGQIFIDSFKNIYKKAKLRTW